MFAKYRDAHWSYRDTTKQEKFQSYPSRSFKYCLDMNYQATNRRILEKLPVLKVLAMHLHGHLNFHITKSPTDTYDTVLSVLIPHLQKFTMVLIINCGGILNQFNIPGLTLGNE